MRETADASSAVKKGGIFLKGLRVQVETFSLNKQTRRGEVSKTKGSGYSSLTAEWDKDNWERSMNKRAQSLIFWQQSCAFIYNSHHYYANCP